MIPRFHFLPSQNPEIRQLQQAVRAITPADSPSVVWSTSDTAIQARVVTRPTGSPASAITIRVNGVLFVGTITGTVARYLWVARDGSAAEWKSATASPEPDGWAIFDTAAREYRVNC